MSNLSKYHVETGKSQAEVARHLGISRSYYSEIVSGSKTPGGALAAKIERATGGAVTSISFFPDASGTVSKATIDMPSSEAAA
ncbi:MAG: helix-turn-helix domain-containing protein [Rhodobacterales bacterium]|uniref:helix-turn-helix domain-containing protein n=1 Tax=Puniceibacterium antarcticum TaxID=1206336 RepID=UPI000C178387|nr:helix-turn-helix transcriptional regulator [Puniceibacterium antarcticum]